jgi:hypothetical protein
MIKPQEEPSAFLRRGKSLDRRVSEESHPAILLEHPTYFDNQPQATPHESASKPTHTLTVHTPIFNLSYSKLVTKNPTIIRNCDPRGRAVSFTSSRCHAFLNLARRLFLFIYYRSKLITIRIEPLKILCIGIEYIFASYLHNRSTRIENKSRHRVFKGQRERTEAVKNQLPFPSLKQYLRSIRFHCL